MEGPETQDKAAVTQGRPGAVVIQGGTEAAPVVAPPLARMLCALRQRAGLSIRQSAAQAGLAPASLSGWERGHHQPRLPELDALLTTLRASRGERREALERLCAPRAIARLRQETSAPPGLARESPSGGDLLRAMRRRRGWTLERTAHAAGVRPHSLSRWETSVTLPTVGHLHALCLALGAHAEEVVALTLHWTRLDEAVGVTGGARDVSEAYMSAVEAGPEALSDLYKLSLEAALMRLAPHDPDALPLLQRLYARYSRGLRDSSRVVEAGAYAERALWMGVPATGSVWEDSVIAVAAAAAVSRAGAERAARYLEGQLEGARSPGYRAWVLSEIAQHLARAGRAEAALARSEAACRLAETVAHPESLFRRRDRASVLLSLGRPEEAVDALAEISAGIPLMGGHAQVRHLLLEGECLLALGLVEQAQGRLSESRRLIEADGLSSLRRFADEVAEKIED